MARAFLPSVFSPHLSLEPSWTQLISWGMQRHFIIGIGWKVEFLFPAPNVSMFDSLTTARLPVLKTIAFLLTLLLPPHPVVHRFLIASKVVPFHFQSPSCPLLTFVIPACAHPCFPSVYLRFFQDHNHICHWRSWPLSLCTLEGLLLLFLHEVYKWNITGSIKENPTQKNKNGVLWVGKRYPTTLWWDLESKPEVLLMCQVKQ